jgi:hypothetical protein
MVGQKNRASLFVYCFKASLKKLKDNVLDYLFFRSGDTKAIVLHEKMIKISTPLRYLVGFIKEALAKWLHGFTINNQATLLNTGFI